MFVDKLVRQKRLDAAKRLLPVLLPVLRGLSAALLLLSITSCQIFSSTAKTDAKTETRALAEFSVASSGTVGCKSLVDNYCTHLYSPEASGNMVIDRRRPIEILQGETPNQLSQVYLHYAETKIKNRRRLPPDFLERLNQYGYFDKLESFIHRNPIPKMSMDERMHSGHLDYELSSLWATAVDQTVVLRMSRKYPGYFKIPDRAMPLEYDVESRRVRRTLISDISRILWHEDANWHRVENGFNSLKASFLTLFDELELPESIRTDWKQKISSVQLVLPGSMPQIADEECSSTTINAYYYRSLNLITVCAGDFNSEDIILTLAHEMSHALGIDRDLSLYLANSSLGKGMTALRENVCEKREQMSCENWIDFKTWIGAGLNDLGAFRPQMAEFNQCLKRGPAQKELTDPDATRISEQMANNRISNLAANDVFLRLIKKKVPIRNGKMELNPNYMDPCAYYLWSTKKESMDDELYTLIFFTAEFRCSTGDENARLKSAIETARRMSAQIIKSVIQREGEFSDRGELVSEGYASPPFERFADVMGSYAISEYLKRFPAGAERRAKYLASTSWLCREPSLESNFPEESKIEQEFNFESHAQSDDRKMELLAPPVREVLQCQKDFVFKECEIPFKWQVPVRVPASAAPETPVLETPPQQ